MTTQAVAKRLVELCQAGQGDKAVQELYAKDIVNRSQRHAGNAGRYAGHRGH